MSDNESASVQFFEDTDDDTVDFHTEVDNQSIISMSQSRGMGVPGRATANSRTTPRRAASPGVSQIPVAAVPAAVPTAQAPQQQHTSSSDDEDAPAATGSAAAASPRGLTATATGRIDGGKKTVVSATLRARAYSQTRGRSPNVPPPSDVPPASSAKEQPSWGATATAEGAAPHGRASVAAPPSTTIAPAHRKPSPVAARDTDTDTDDAGTSPGTANSNFPMGATTTLDAAGLAALLQVVAQNQQQQLHTMELQSRAIRVAAPQTPSEASAARIATLNFETLQRHSREALQHQQQLPPPMPLVATVAPVIVPTTAQQPALLNLPGGQSLASSRARRIALSNDIVAAAPPAEMGAETREEAAQITLGWYRDFNGEQKKQLHALQARVDAEREALAREKQAATDRLVSEAHARRQAELSPTDLHSTFRAADKDRQRQQNAAASTAPGFAQRQSALVASKSASRSMSAGALRRSASNRGASRASPPAAAPPPPPELEPSMEAVVRGVASRYGVVLPHQKLTGGKDSAVVLPDRLFFATGVQLTREQRAELLSKMRDAMRAKGNGALAAAAVGPAPWLAPVETDLGSRAPSLQRVFLDNKARIVAADSLSSPARQTQLTRAANGGPVTPPESSPRHRSGPSDWAPFVGEMRQRTREGGLAEKRTQTQIRSTEGAGRTRKRTEVLRDLFLVLDVHQRRVIRRAEIELLYQQLAAADCGGGATTAPPRKLVDELRYSSSSSKSRRDLVLRFVEEYVLPLLLLSGFEEFDFPLFAQILLRVADREALPSDFAFQPTAQSPLASHGRKGEPRSELDMHAAADGVRGFLATLCVVASS